MAKVFTITEGLENMGALKTGGQGSVYKGRRTGEIITAVKLLPTPIHSESPDDKHFADFQNEVHKLKRVNAKPNPNVVKILSSGITETGSLPFIEMEYVEGPDLEDLLKLPHDPVFSVKEAIKVADQLSNALSHCHQVGVKHGDIKTNNVKFNIHTGNYVLLDFGMSMMSDEQRRTSLRHAGAVEFMAPEQSEGRILPQTDVYSFGVVLFELLAGTVPFPLKDGGEMSRNSVMLAHLESEPPDLLSIRRAALPATWTEAQKAAEMQVPEWLINTIYICLQKAPDKRFEDGKALHDYIALRNTKSVAPITESPELLQLRSEKQQWLREKAMLQQQLASYQTAQPITEPIRQTYTKQEAVAPKRSSNFLYVFIIAAVLGGVGFMWWRWGRVKRNDPEPVSNNLPEPKINGQYKVVASKAFFYNEPDPATKRSAFMTPSDEVLNTTDERNSFVYAEFTNSRGQTSKGWLRKADLVPADQYNTSPQATDYKFSPQEVRTRLADARRLMESGQTSEALAVYNVLADQYVPEAIYEVGNAGLQKKASGIDCGKAYTMVQTASDKGYAPAKRTLGFLYFFADNPDILQINSYQNCSYERNVFKGTKLLMEAVLAGDTTAKRLVEELNIGRMPPALDSSTQQ